MTHVIHNGKRLAITRYGPGGMHDFTTYRLTLKTKHRTRSVVFETWGRR